jgi:hypothetical protein
MARQTLQKTMDQLLLHIRAGYPVIYIVSHEEARVIDFLSRALRVINHGRASKKHFWLWYADEGMQELRFPELTGFDSLARPIEWLNIPALDPNQGPALAVSTGGLEALNQISTSEEADWEDSMTVFLDLHPHLHAASAEPLVRPLRNAATRLRRYYQNAGKRYKTLVIVAPSREGLSPELERDLLIIDFPLPERDELKQALRIMEKAGTLRMPTPNDPIEPKEVSSVCGARPREEYAEALRDTISGAGRGLTLADYRLGLNLFAVQQGDKFMSSRHVEEMLDLKAKAFRSPALEYTPHVDIELGGLDAVKQWVRQRRDAAVSDSVRKDFDLPAPKGTLLCGASGGGKSQLAKLIAKEFNLALLRLDVGSLFGSYIGESEQKTRDVLKLAEALAPVVLWIDEIDKAFAGMKDGGDNGVSRRVLGYFLTWLSEKEDSIFVAATANDFDALLSQFPEFGRKGRFDQIWWVGLPGEVARKSIFNVYLKPALETNARRSERGLLLNDEDIEAVATRYEIASAAITGTTSLEKLCSVLAHKKLSEHLTGAEIEHAVSSAKYAAYDRFRGNKECRMDPSILADCVKKVCDQGLYRATSKESTKLKALMKDAQDKGWPDAETGEVAGLGP